MYIYIYNYGGIIMVDIWISDIYYGYIYIHNYNIYGGIIMVIYDLIYTIW